MHWPKRISSHSHHMEILDKIKQYCIYYLYKFTIKREEVLVGKNGEAPQNGRVGGCGRELRQLTLRYAMMWSEGLKSLRAALACGQELETLPMDVGSGSKEVPWLQVESKHPPWRALRRCQLWVWRPNSKFFLETETPKQGVSKNTCQEPMDTRISSKDKHFSHARESPLFELHVLSPASALLHVSPKSISDRMRKK